MTCQACAQEAASRLPRGVYLHHTCPWTDRASLPVIAAVSHPRAFAFFIAAGVAALVIVRRSA